MSAVVDHEIVPYLAIEEAPCDVTRLQREIDRECGFEDRFRRVRLVWPGTLTIRFEGVELFPYVRSFRDVQAKVLYIQTGMDDDGNPLYDEIGVPWDESLWSDDLAKYRADNPEREPCVVGVRNYRKFFPFDRWVVQELMPAHHVTKHWNPAFDRRDGAYEYMFHICTDPTCGDVAVCSGERREPTERDVYDIARRWKRRLSDLRTFRPDEDTPAHYVRQRMRSAMADVQAKRERQLESVYREILESVPGNIARSFPLALRPKSQE